LSSLSGLFRLFSLFGQSRLFGWPEGHWLLSTLVSWFVS